MNLFTVDLHPDQNLVRFLQQAVENNIARKKRVRHLSKKTSVGEYQKRDSSVG